MQAPISLDLVQMVYIGAIMYFMKCGLTHLNKAKGFIFQYFSLLRGRISVYYTHFRDCKYCQKQHEGKCFFGIKTRGINSSNGVSFNRLEGTGKWIN